VHQCVGATAQRAACSAQPASVHQCISASMHQCISASVHQCISASVNQCISTSVHQCISAHHCPSVHQGISASVHQCTNASMHQCPSLPISASWHQYPSVPISAAVLSNAHHNAHQWSRLQRATAATYAQVSMHMGFFPTSCTTWI
jgi:hypothetical protein